MDLTGYGYKRGAALRQQIPQVTTGPASSSTERSPELSGEALRLLVKLDTKVALNALFVHFPRVLNTIAAVWNRPTYADRCFDDLLLDSRGQRLGFPQTVISEITSLRHFYLTHVFPRRVDPWEQSLLR